MFILLSDFMFSATAPPYLFHLQRFDFGRRHTFKKIIAISAYVGRRGNTKILQLNIPLCVGNEHSLQHKADINLSLQHITVL